MVKGILTISELDITHELDEPKVSQYRMVQDQPVPYGLRVERVAVDKPIVLVTSNMPKELRDKIDKTIKEYCNH